MSKPVTFCANCEGEAVSILEITPKLGGKVLTLPLCQSCLDAFEWGIEHGKDGDNIEETTIEEED